MRLKTLARSSSCNCLKSPPLGGDAIFASMYSAFKSPEDTEKTKAERLIALHSLSDLTSFYEKEALKALLTEKTPVKNHV